MQSDGKQSWPEPLSDPYQEPIRPREKPQETRRPGPPLFSLIVPGYNIRPYLERCFQSILAQTSWDFELIFIDDGSTDGTGEEMERLSLLTPMPSLVLHQENKGPGGARNAGIQKACGRYLVFIDGDDEVEEDLIYTLSKLIHPSRPQVIVYNGSVVDGEGKLTPMRYCGDYEGVYEPSQEKAMVNTYGGVWNKAVSRSYYLEKGFSFPEGVWYEDAGISRLFLMAAGQVTFTQKRLYRYHQRDLSIMHSPVLPRMRDDCLFVSENFRHECQRLGLSETFQKEICFTLLCLVLLQVGGGEINRRDPKSPLQKDLSRYILSLYGGLPSCPYIRPKARLRLLLFLHGHYRLYHWADKYLR